MRRCDECGYEQIVLRRERQESEYDPVERQSQEDIRVKKIVLTGVGTAGHVTPNIALIEKLKSEGYDISYIGSKGGIEERLIGRIGIPYYGVSTGKLRRYLSLKNISDVFKVLAGMRQAKKLLTTMAWLSP